MYRIYECYDVNQDRADEMKEILKEKYNAFLVCYRVNVSEYKLDSVGVKHCGIYTYYVFCEDKIYTPFCTHRHLNDLDVLDMVKEKTVFIGCNSELKYFIATFEDEIMKNKMVKLLNYYSRNDGYLDSSTDRVIREYNEKERKKEIIG